MSVQKGSTSTGTNQYCLTGEEHFEAYKEMFGAENVEWVTVVERETVYGKSCLLSLENTDNFTESAIEHIFEGQINTKIGELAEGS